MNYLVFDDVGRFVAVCIYSKLDLQPLILLIMFVIVACCTISNCSTCTKVVYLRILLNSFMSNFGGARLLVFDFGEHVPPCPPCSASYEISNFTLLQSRNDRYIQSNTTTSLPMRKKSIRRMAV